MNAESIISRATLEPVKVCRECQADASCHECGTALEAGARALLPLVIMLHRVGRYIGFLRRIILKLQQKYPGGWGDVSVGSPPQHVEYQQCGSRGIRFSRSCRPNSIFSST